MDTGEIENILTFEEYLNIRHEVPYTYDVTFSGRSLRYFGVNHVYDPNSPLFSLLISEIQTYCPDLILVEGCEPLRRVYPEDRRRAFLQTFRDKSEEEAIRRYGESGCAVLEALSRGIEVLCPEPSFAEEAADLLERGHQRDALFLYYMYRTLPHWLEIRREPEFEEYAKHDIRMMVDTGVWSSTDCTLEEVEQASQRMWGSGIPLNDERSLNLRFWPSYFGGEGVPSTQVNGAARESVYFRDRYIVGEICDALENYERIFIVYGSQHAVFQENSLKALARIYGANTAEMKAAWRRVIERGVTENCPRNR